MHSERQSTLSPEAIAVGRRIKRLRDFLALLDENGQLAVWEEEVLPEPDIRNLSVAAGRDAMHGPAVLLTNIKGCPGKQVVVGVHGSFTNLALLLGQPKGTPVKELFYEMVNRWGSDEPLIERVSPAQAPVLTHRVEDNINLYELLPLYRINEYDGGFYIDKANVVSRDPSDPEDFGKQNVGIYRIQVHGPDMFSLDAVPSHDMGQHIRIAEREDAKLNMAAMIGNHPALAMFAGTPVDYDESEYAYASQMMGRRMGSDQPTMTETSDNKDKIFYNEASYYAWIALFLPQNRTLKENMRSCTSVLHRVNSFAVKQEWES